MPKTLMGSCARFSGREIQEICDQIDGRSFCALGDAAAWPVRAFIKNFRHEFEYYVKHGRSMYADNPESQAMFPSKGYQRYNPMRYEYTFGGVRK